MVGLALMPAPPPVHHHVESTHKQLNIKPANRKHHHHPRAAAAATVSQATLSLVDQQLPSTPDVPVREVKVVVVVVVVVVVKVVVEEPSLILFHTCTRGLF